MSKVYIAQFKSRNKDNKDPRFKERVHTFLTTKKPTHPSLIKKYEEFKKGGLGNEICRYYYSVNARDTRKIKKEMIRYLLDQLDNEELNPRKLNSLAPSIAQKSKCRSESKWLLDYDENDPKKAKKVFKHFKNELAKIENLKIVEEYFTPHGFHIIVNHGFDSQELEEKFPNLEIKKDNFKNIFI